MQNHGIRNKQQAMATQITQRTVRVCVLVPDKYNNNHNIFYEIRTADFMSHELFLWQISHNYR